SRCIGAAFDGLVPADQQAFPPRPVPKNLLSAHSTNGVSGGTNHFGTNALATNVANLATNTAPVVEPPAEEHLEVLETADARYTFTSVGGGLKLVELKKYPAIVSCDAKERNNPTNVASLNTRAPSPAFAIYDGAGSGGMRSFHLFKTGETVRAEAAINSNGLYLIKEFRLSTNYTVQTRVRYENRSGEAQQLPERALVIGTATPMGQRDETMMLGLEWYNGSKTEKIVEPWFANYTMGCRMFGGAPRTEYRADTTNVAWAAVNNQFFTMIARPETNTPVSGVVGRRILLPVPSQEEMKKDPQAFAHPVGYQTALLLPPQQLAQQSFYEYHFQLFAGPKEYKTLSRLPENMDLVMGFGGFFGFFAQALLLAMNAIHAIGIPYGLAIIVITVVIKGFFWPLTTASTRSMKRMAALQPQMKALQEKYKDDPRKMNSKLMEFMKENKVSPMGGCLPVLLQIPVFFGFYKMLQSAIELRGASFLWACDLSQPDTIFHIGGFPVNPLPLFMGATMLWQARLTPPSPGMDPAQQKMMRYMPLVMVVFLYNYSAGLALYWATQNLLSIAQMKLTKTTEPTPGGTAPAAGQAAARPKKK
ncbi:MAG: membrane protein insertase YidC, partial [Verrucomicrobiota bacterium]